MGEAEISAYQEAKVAWDAARGQVESMAGEIERVAQAIQHNPLRFMVSNVPEGDSPGLRLSNTVVLDGRRWPTAESLAAMLSELREATFTVRNAWAALSEAEQGQVEPAEGALI